MSENNWSNKQQGAIGRFHHHKGDEYPYSQGCVFTPYGIVAVYYEPRTVRSKGYINLSIVLGGRHINRVAYKGNLTERGLVTVAHRFAKKVANG